MSQNIIEKLKTDGYRITLARRAIVELLQNSPSPITPSQIKEHLLSGGLKVNKTTVYRELDFLIRKNFVKQVIFMDGEIRYEIFPQYCHHHIVCKECGEVSDVTIEERSLIEMIEKQSHFKIENHSIEFQGICQNCQ